MKTLESGIEKRRAVYLGRRISNTTISVVLSFVVTAAAQSERINQEGRILGAAPVVTTPTLFNTPQADAIVSAMQIFSVTNPWNEESLSSRTSRRFASAASRTIRLTIRCTAAPSRIWQGETWHRRSVSTSGKGTVDGPTTSSASRSSRGNPGGDARCANYFLGCLGAANADDCGQ